MTLSPLSTALGALLETGLNQLLSLDPRSRLPLVLILALAMAANGRI